jgi:hypothetical protein
MITSIASPSARKNAASGARVSAGRRVSANANSVANTITGSTASLAAAAIGLVGSSERRKSASVGTAGATRPTTGGPRAKPPRLPPGAGKSPSRKGIATAANIAEPQSRTRKVITDRAARRPACAASDAAVMPVISRLTSNGMIVICSALSQSVPIGSTNPTDSAAPCGTSQPPAAPSRIPAARAPTMARTDFIRCEVAEVSC